MRVLRPVASAANSKTLVMGLTRPQMEAFVRALSPEQVENCDPAADHYRSAPQAASAHRRTAPADGGQAADWTRRRRPGFGSACNRTSKVSTASSRRLPWCPPPPCWSAASRRATASLRHPSAGRTSSAFPARIRWLGYLPSEDVPGAFRGCRCPCSSCQGRRYRRGHPGGAHQRAAGRGDRAAVASRRISSAAVAASCLPLRSMSKDFAAALSKVCGPENAAFSRKRHCLWRISRALFGPVGRLRPDRGGDLAEARSRWRPMPAHRKGRLPSTTGAGA